MSKSTEQLIKEAQELTVKAKVALAKQEEENKNPYLKWVRNLIKTKTKRK